MQTEPEGAPSPESHSDFSCSEEVPAGVVTSTVHTSRPNVPDYELIRRIGRGSYGEVWLARNVLGDLRAVKVVYRRNFDHDRPYEREFEGIKKFEPISRLHESQVDILHVGRNDAAGCFYYVMELADPAKEEGRVPSPESQIGTDGSVPVRVDSYVPRTLKLELYRRGRLPVKECVEIGLALTTALENLHSRGLVHRDVKPSNIIFVGGVPKLADIGLVAAIDEARSLVGTIGYVPPEGPGSPQADLFSVGKVLYEVSLGHDRQEFPRLPPDLSSHPDHAGILELNEVIVKACDSDVRIRYQSAKEMQEDLVRLQQGFSVRRRNEIRKRLAVARRIALFALALTLLLTAGWLVSRNFQATATRPMSFPALVELNSIAILPFENEGKDPAHRYLCDALAIETMNALTNCAGLRVAPQSAVMGFKGETNDLRRIGGELGVRTVLAGEFLRSSNGMSVSLRLLDVTTNAPVWTARFEVGREELGVLGSKAVSATASVLGFSLEGSVVARLERNLMARLQAYRLFSQARSQPRNTQAGLNKSFQLLNQALVHDLEFAEVYAYLALCYSEAGDVLLPPGQAVGEAKKNALRALQLDGGNANAHVTLGRIIAWHELNLPEGEAHFRRAIETAPTYANAYAEYAGALLFHGQVERAEEMLRLGEKADANDHNIHGIWCWRYCVSRQFDELLLQAIRLRALHSNSIVGPMFMAMAHEQLGNLATALELAQQLNERDPGPDFIALVGFIHGRMGHAEAARQALEELGVLDRSRRVSPLFFAQVLLGLGDREGALDYLRRGLKEGPSVAQNLKMFPWWDELQSDPRFIEMCERSKSQP